MNTPEYTFDFTKMSLGDIVFLSSIDASTHRDPANVKRLFQLLGRVTVGIDTIPVAELGAVMQAMTTALIDHIKISAIYGDFVETLTFDPPPAVQPDKRCPRCLGPNPEDGLPLCAWCMMMDSF